MKPQSDRRVVATLSLYLLVASTLIPVAAQVGNQRRITSVWTATNADGSRVHIDSDSLLNDYAGYTRGDRFYVTIPLADLPTARGSLLGRGFDDVQIQRYGDGIIISFHLQPGTTARVEQISGRLQVVFSTPGKYQGSGSEMGDEATGNRPRARRITDVAGPAPAPTSVKSAPRRSSGVRSFQDGDGMPNAPVQHRTTNVARAKAGSGSSASNSGSKPSQSGSTATSKPTPLASSKQAPTPSNAGSPATAETSSKTTPPPSPSPVASASPTASLTSTSSASASPNITSGLTAAPATPEPSPSTATQNAASNREDNEWAARLHYWKVWAELNWLPLLIGGLIFLALLVLLLTFRGAKRRRARFGRRAEPDQMDTPAVTVASRANPPTAPASAPVNETAVEPKPSQALPAEQYDHGGGDQEREVFEL